MTVGGIILYVFFVLIYVCIGVGVGFCIGDLLNSKKWIGLLVGLVLTIALSLGTFGLMHWYYNNTAAGQRAFKSQESNFNNGIERIVEVYDVNGKLIRSYEGKFDIAYDNDRIIFDDENGKRHVIYYPTGTIIVDEK